MSKNKIIIAVAPTGGWGRGKNNPLSPEEVAGEVLGCAGEGAALAHFHSRDLSGELTADMKYFSKTVELIRSESDIILEASTGGLSEMTADERALPVHVPGADLGSLNMGSLNFGDEVYQNSLPDIRYWAELMSRAGVKPSLEIFDTGHLETALSMIKNGDLSTPANFSFIFDVKWGMPYDSNLLDFLISRVPQNCHWGALFVGSSNFEGHLEAAAKGASYLRAGFEDSREYNGIIAQNNIELVRALREKLESAGYQIVSISEAREMLLK